MTVVLERAPARDESELARPIGGTDAPARPSRRQAIDERVELERVEPACMGWIEPRRGGGTNQRELGRCAVACAHSGWSLARALRPLMQ